MLCVILTAPLLYLAFNTLITRSATTLLIPGEIFARDISLVVYLATATLCVVIVPLNRVMVSV